MKEFYDVYKTRDSICVSFYPLPKEQPKQEELREKLRLDYLSQSKQNSGIYIHIPFCEKICGFCPFNKLKKEDSLVERYIKALKKELRIYSKSEYAKASEFDSVYIGGGTPTSLSTNQLLEILNFVKSNFHMTKDAVYFVEGNPMNYEEEKMKRLAEFGVNRISMGVQTFSDKLAKNIGLPQTPKQSIEAIETAHKVGINNVGIDLMYPLPGMNYADWISSIQKSVELMVDHVCIIPFCILPNTPIDNNIKNHVIPDVLGEDDQITMYCIARDMLLDAGYIQYSVLDFGLPEKVDRAALNYFKNQAELLAFGPAAYGYVNGYTYFNVGDIHKYMEMVENDELPIIVGADSNHREQMHGMMTKGLRMLNVSIKEFIDLFGEDPREVFKEKIADLVKRGLIEINEENIGLTTKGIIWGNDVCKEFFSEDSLKNQISRVDLAKGQADSK